MTASRSRTLAWVALVLAQGARVPAPLAGQVVGRPSEAPSEPVDSADVRGRARREQARLEMRRARLLPIARGGPRSGGRDEIVGRFCVWFDEREGPPPAEPPAIDSVRGGLVAYLDSVQALVPGDAWVLGQRVWYLGEGGHWNEALAAARSCVAGGAGRCDGLEGLALHMLGRYQEAEAAFGRDLDAMAPERAGRLREPRRVLRRGVRDVLDDASGAEHAVALARVWALADPLWLVPGNDRWTEHMARWTVAGMRDHARNTHGIGWGRDLEELLVRYGWEVAWAKQRSWDIASDAVIGHHHPASLEYMPSPDAVRDPAHAAPEDLQPGAERPRSLYAPRYAPVVLPMEGQLAAFPRADRLIVVATAYVPADTTLHPGDDEPRPWMEPGDQAGRPDERGLFLLPLAGGPPLGASRTGEGGGALLLEVPAGAWVASVESWRPPARLAGRTRRGLARDTVPRDVATLSDLLLVEGGGGEPASLDEAARRALPRRRLDPGAEIGVVWEVNGLGWTPATVSYDLSLEPARPGLFRRLGQGLGLVDRQRPLSVVWQEPGPDQPSVALRQVAVTLPDVDPGTYSLRLRATITGRADLVSETEVVVGSAR